MPADPPEVQYPRLRQSLLSEFDNCALTTKFTLDYRNLPEEFMVREGGGRTDFSNHPQARGQLTHRTLSRCLTEMAAQGEETIEIDVAQAILLEVLRQHDVPPDEVVSVPMKMAADLYWIVTSWAYNTRFSTANLVDTEDRLTSFVQIPTDDGSSRLREITGQLDALFIEGEVLEHAIVMDWKDTWMLPPPKEISFGGFFQQRFYGLLVMDAYPSVQSVTLREFYVRYSSRKNGKDPVREATIHREDLEEVRQEIAALVERFDRAVAEDSWKPTPGAHCTWCKRPTACPIFPTARGEGAIGSEDEAERAGAQLTVAKAVVKQLTGQVKAWADGHGPVPIRDAKGDRVWGFQESTRTAKPDPGEVKEALVKAPSLDAVDVDGLYRTSKTTRFGEFVIKPVEPGDDIMEKLKLSIAQAEERVRDAE